MLKVFKNDFKNMSTAAHIIRVLKYIVYIITNIHIRGPDEIRQTT